MAGHGRPRRRLDHHARIHGVVRGFAQDAAYVASKGAILAMTKAMALDGGPVGIRVNAVCPGFI